MCCQGRLVSILEGGYGHHRPGHDANAATGLDRAPLGEAAVAHVRALLDPYADEAAATAAAAVSSVVVEGGSGECALRTGQ